MALTQSHKLAPPSNDCSSEISLFFRRRHFCWLNYFSWQNSSGNQHYLKPRTNCTHTHVYGPNNRGCRNESETLFSSELSSLSPESVIIHSIIPGVFLQNTKFSLGKREGLKRGVTWAVRLCNFWKYLFEVLGRFYRRVFFRLTQRNGLIWDWVQNGVVTGVNVI